MESDDVVLRLKESERRRCKDIADESANQYAIELNENGFADYLGSTLGGMRNESEIRCDCLRVGCFLSFDENLYEEVTDIKSKLDLLFNQVYNFQKFIYYLEISRSAKPSTVLKYIDACRSASNWLGVGYYLRFHQLISQIRRKFKKSAKVRLVADYPYFIPKLYTYFV
jgi:hypothetical protein